MKNVTKKSGSSHSDLDTKTGITIAKTKPRQRRAYFASIAIYSKKEEKKRRFFFFDESYEKIKMEEALPSLDVFHNTPKAISTSFVAHPYLWRALAHPLSHQILNYFLWI